MQNRSSMSLLERWMRRGQEYEGIEESNGIGDIRIAAVAGNGVWSLDFVEGRQSVDLIHDSDI